MQCQQQRRSSRPALVERTNSDDLHDMIMVHQPPSCQSTKQQGSGKQKRRKSILKEQNRSSSPTASSSSSSSSCRVSFAKDDIKFYDPSDAAETVSTVSSASEQELQKQQQHSPSSPNAALPYHYLGKRPSWMGDCTLSSTDVFHKRLNRPACVIQAIVRGVIQRRKFRQVRIDRLRQELYELECYAVSLIQAQFRGMQQRRRYALSRAAIPMQAAVRGWICRLKVQATNLQQRLTYVQVKHQRELREIQEHKQRKMKCIYMELSEEASKKDRELKARQEEVEHLIEDLRENNTQLRFQNDTLRKACLIMAKKNKATMELTRSLHKNIREVERTLPKLQTDHDNIARVHRECKQVVKQHQIAVRRCTENYAGEIRISNLFEKGIYSMLEEIQAKSSKSKKGDPKLAESMSKTAKKRIRIAKKEQEKSNKEADDKYSKKPSL